MLWFLLFHTRVYSSSDTLNEENHEICCLTSQPDTFILSVNARKLFVFFFTFRNLQSASTYKHSSLCSYILVVIAHLVAFSIFSVTANYRPLHYDIMIDPCTTTRRICHVGPLGSGQTEMTVGDGRHSS